jgi:hypothetical protein
MGSMPSSSLIKCGRSVYSSIQVLPATILPVCNVLPGQSNHESALFLHLENTFGSSRYVIPISKKEKVILEGIRRRPVCQQLD